MLRNLAATRSGASAQAWHLPHLIEWLEGQGLDASKIRRLPGLADLTDPEVRVPESSVEAAWRIAVTLAEDEAIGIAVAESMPRGGLDLVEYAFRASASLAAGLDEYARYGRLINDRAAARAEANAEGLLLLFRDAGQSPLHPCRAEFALALALRLARDGAGADITPLRVCFAHLAPRDTSAHRRFFRVAVRFDAGTNSMLLSEADAARPMRGADAALSLIVSRRLEKALAERLRRTGDTWSERVRDEIVAQIAQATLTPDGVARSLAMGQRTMSRRLAAEGTSFRALLDDVRRELACTLLQDRSLQVGDVAFFLQYSEPAAFHRSFKRWTGRTPTAFRNSP